MSRCCAWQNWPSSPAVRWRRTWRDPRCSMTPRADLRGAVLRGEDLSLRGLEEVDLTGADLTDVRLVRPNLRGARLRGARLVGARLDHTRLTDADLTGADLARARVLGAHLRGASIEDTGWRRAVLVDVDADPDLFTTARRRGAAIAPGDPVIPGLAPP